MENYFGIYVIFRSWNHRKRRPTQPKSAQWWVVPTSYIGWSSTSGARKLISRKIVLNLSAIGVTDLREYEKLFLARSRECVIEEYREGDPISEGLPPLRRHGDQGPEGELSSPSRGEAKDEEVGGLSPPRFRWRRSAIGAMIGTTIYVNNLATVHTNSLPLIVVV